MAEAADDMPELAGEYALGVLEGDELIEARKRLLADPAFAQEVRWWRHRLACIAEAAGSVEPSPHVWPAIERKLAAGGNGDDEVVRTMPQRPAVTGISGWGLGAALAGVASLAAAVTLFLASPATQPAVDPAPELGDRYIAHGASEDGAISIAGVLEPDADRLSLRLAGFKPGEGQAPELWVVPEGGAPVSLGLIPVSGLVTRDLTTEQRALLAEGAILAVTYEPATNAPHAAPSTDILVVSPLTKV